MMAVWAVAPFDVRPEQVQAGQVPLFGSRPTHDTEDLTPAQRWVVAELTTMGITTIPQLVRHTPRNPVTDQPKWSAARIRSVVKSLVDRDLVEHVDDLGITQGGAPCARYQVTGK